MTARRLLQISFSNLGLKIFALFVSILVWFHAATERTYSTEKNVRVEYTGLNDSLFIMNNPPENLRVRVVGKGKSLINMSLFARPEAIINLSELKPGKNSMDIDWNVLTIPHGLGVEVEADRVGAATTGGAGSVQAGAAALREERLVQLDPRGRAARRNRVRASWSC